MHGTPADVFPDVVTMGLRRGSSVRARWNLAPKLKFHRAATDMVLSNKRHGCLGGVRPSSVKIASLAHRNLIGRARWLGHNVAFQNAFVVWCRLKRRHDGVTFGNVYFSFFIYFTDFHNKHLQIYWIFFFIFSSLNCRDASSEILNSDHP